jgi:hypothetical protein
VSAGLFKRRSRPGTAPAPAPASFSRRTALAAVPAVALTGGIAMPKDSPDWTTNVVTPQTIATGSPYALTAGINDVTVAVTPDTYVLGISVQGSPTISLLKVVGEDSGVVYLNLASSAGPIGSVQYVPILSATDTNVLIQITVAASTEMNVVLMGQSSGTIVYPANRQLPVEITQSTTTLSVTQVAGTANPWIHPTGILHIDTGALANLGTATLIPAVALEQIYLFTLLLAPLDLGTTVDVYDGTATGTKIDTFVGPETGTPVNAATPTMAPHEYHAVALTAGNALTVQNTSGGTHRWVGYVVYSQA